MDFMSSLPKPARQLLESTSVPCTFCPGDLIKRSDDALWAGIVVTGVVRVYCGDEEGNELTLQRLGPGGIIGLAALVGALGGDEARALTRVVVDRWDGRAIRQLRLAAAFNLAVAREAYGHLVTARRDGSRRHGRLKQRIAAELIGLATLRDGGSDVIVKITHQMLGEAVGSSREVVSRRLEELGSMGLVSQVRRGELEIKEPAALRSIGGMP